MNEQDLRKIFVKHKVDIPDKGFSERVIRQLPERKNSILPQMVMAVFIIIGLALMFAIQGVTPLLDQINSLITSISQLQAPSPSAIITYLGMLALVGTIGYSMVHTE